MSGKAVYSDRTYDLIQIFDWTEYAYHAKLIENYLDSRMSEEECVPSVETMKEWHREHRSNT